MSEENFDIKRSISNLENQKKEYEVEIDKLKEPHEQDAAQSYKYGICFIEEIIQDLKSKNIDVSKKKNFSGRPFDWWFMVISADEWEREKHYALPKSSEFILNVVMPVTSGVQIAFKDWGREEFLKDSLEIKENE